MIAFKKFYGDELLKLALVLSLLKADPDDFLERETQQLIAGMHISNGSDWSLEHEARTLIRPRFIHPKSVDHMLVNYERQLFEELNSLGRYSDSFNIANNDRMWNNRGPILHTYLVNNVATDTVVPGLATASEPEATADHDGVSADDNVAQEVKITDDGNEEETDQTPEEEQIKNNTVTEEPVEPAEQKPAVDQEASSDQEVVPRPDLVVTLSPDFLSNHTESDIFAEIATRSFDVNDFLVQPSEMQFKKDDEVSERDSLEVRVKKEEESDDLYSDNAIDFVPYYATKSEKYDHDEPNSVFDQNMSDLQDYEEMFDDVKDLRHNLELDVKHQQNDLEQYLLENTHLDSDAYGLMPMFGDELILDVKRERASTSFSTSATSSGVSDMDLDDVKMEPDDDHHTGDELTQEDMDLIEVLWKQDVDMGFCIDNPLELDSPEVKKLELDKCLESEKYEEPKPAQKSLEGVEEVNATLLDPDAEEDNPWAGLRYTVDTETGEYVLQGELPEELTTDETRFDLLEEALQLVELGDEAEANNEQPKQPVESSSGSGAGADADAGDDMLHPAMRHVPHHPLAHYHNPSLMRSMSMEQRWQDLASLLPIPPPPDHYQHYHHHQHHPHPPHPHPHNISAHGAAGYTPNYHHTPIAAVPEKHPDAYAGAAAPIDGAYKVESAHQPQSHDGLYYQNTTAEMAPPTNSDGFLQSILNDEDLQLMDMAMNEGMYTMRMLDGAGAHHAPHHNHTHMMMTAERDSASDSAVSSMGSERVPSLSDGEWCDGSDSAQEFHSSKFRPYDAAAYGRERAAHLPQKKHQMFGKRCFQEQNPSGPPMLEQAAAARAPVKYECPEQAYHDNMHMHAEYAGRQQLPALGPALQPALDLNPPHTTHALLQSGLPPAASPPRFAYASAERVRHNHTYSAPLAPHDPRPAPPRDKRVRRLTDGSVSDAGSSASGGHSLSRDEKRAKALGIPLEVHDIINLPMDEFNERLSKHDLSEAQLSLIRDIRRRGKNKVAAQNCRKRKLDQITSLADEVRSVRDRRQRVQRDHHSLHAERQRVKERFAALYRHVFQNLRDAEGRPLSSSQYSLQQAADGNVVLVPKMGQPTDHPMNRTSDDDMDRKKNYEQ